MGRMTKTMNTAIGAVRSIVAAFLATVLILALFPTITMLAGVLRVGIFMFVSSDFYALLLMLMAIFLIANILSKIVIPDLPSGE